jgi:hypothetical protein
LIPVVFKGANLMFGKPVGMTNEQCGQLPAMRTRVDLMPAIESVFELSDEEMEELKKTKRIRLSIIGAGMPPVMLKVEPLELNTDEESESHVK